VNPVKAFCLWLQRFYILGFLLFAWHIAPFSRFSPLFPVAWSLVVGCTVCALPTRTRTYGKLVIQGPLIGLLVGLTFGAADWTVLDFTLLFEFCWALMPLFLFDRFYARACARRSHPPHPSCH
jgi:hypothetical protein